MSSSQAVRPRDAASLIIYRGNGRDKPLEIVLGRRQSRSSFMPNVYVFPGGAVDRTDARILPGTPLPTDMQQSMAVANNATRARTIALAAIRETFEETGLLLTVPGSVANRRPPASWQPFFDRKLAPNLANLHYLGRALTPSHRPIRFHARFFAVHERHVSGTPVSSEELLDVDWYTADPDALRDQKITLMGVTERMLLELAALVTSGQDSSTHIGDLFYTGRGDRRIVTGNSLVSE